MLKTVDDAERTLTYSIDDGPDAVSKNNVTGYVGKVRVLPVTDTNGSFVEWSSSWENSNLPTWAHASECGQGRSSYTVRCGRVASRGLNLTIPGRVLSSRATRDYPTTVASVLGLR